MEEDEQMPEDQRTAEIANKISEMIKVKEDVPSNHPSGRIPILDLEVWVQGKQIYHCFYKKPMASRKVVCAKSALPTSVKRSILLEEGKRRLKNCSPELAWNEKVLQLNRMSSDMKHSGHTQNFRNLILRRIVANYTKSLSNHLEGVHQMYRNKQERDDQKKTTAAMSSKDNWFRSGGATSTLCVPPTPGKELARRVETNLGQSRQPEGTRIKVVEGNGVSICRGMVKTNQFPRGVCYRRDCVICFHKDGEEGITFCDRSNVGYEGDCTRCSETKYRYVGETSRTGYTRSKEHLGDYRAASLAKLPPLPTPICGTAPRKKQDVKSWMWEHTRDVHGGQVGTIESDYKFRVTKNYRKCLDRQVSEDILMKTSERDGYVLLNSKNEYYTPKTVETIFRQQ